MKKRSFVAIHLPAEAAAAYRQYGRQAAGRWPDARWTAVENLHVTVCFFGDVEAGDLPALSGGLKAAVAAAPSFILTPAAIVLAPPGRRPPSMIWATFSGSGYAGLARAVRAAAARFAPAMPAEKELLPHATLARFKDRTVAPASPPLPPFAAGIEPFAVTACLLMESRLTPHGPSYAELERFELGAGAG